MTDRHLPAVFRTTVVRTERLTPHLVRVVLTGPGSTTSPARASATATAS